jgi:hydroxyquinol 1,2-dioxygenase
MTTQDLADEALTQAVVDSFADTRDPRLREVLESLVRHLHAFAADVALTEAEWAAAVEFLTRTGHMSDERRQEFILLSDVLGLSMLVVGLNHRASPQATESTVFGPFFVEGSPAVENGGDLAGGAPGRPCFFSGRVLSADGTPLPGAHLEVWQADEDGFYDVQVAGLGEPRGRGHLRAGEDGRFAFWSVRPEAYPIPDDGPVGDLLEATGRSPMRPAHVHFLVRAPGHATLITHVFAAGDAHLGSDAVFGVKRSLVTPFEERAAGTPAPDGRVPDVPYVVASYDLVLAPVTPAGGA